MFKRPVYRGVIFAFRNSAQSHFISMSAVDVLRLLFPVTMVIVASPACRLSHQSGQSAQPIGGILKNQKKKMLVPIALAVSAALAFGTTSVSAKAGSGQVKAAAKCATKLKPELDKKMGAGAAFLARAIACGNTNPMKATGKYVIKIGFAVPEGPVVNFTEYRIAALAAVDYINKELGGVGADPATGKAGVPIKLVPCSFNIMVPTEQSACVNSLAESKPALVVSTLSFDDTVIAKYAAAKIPVLVGTPIMPSDFTTPGVFAIGGGGGCLGVHLGMVYYATQILKKKKIALPWAGSAPGIFCFNDLEAKPLDILAGQTQSGKEITTTSKLKGSMAGLTYLPIKVPTVAPDVASYAAQITKFDPDVLIYSNQGNLCWDLMTELIKNGWVPGKYPIVLSGACIDLATMAKFGAKINGIVTLGGLSILDPDALTGEYKIDALTYGTKMFTYSKDRKLTGTGFATQGFGVLMFAWQMMNEAMVGGKLDVKKMVTAIKTTNGHRAFGTLSMNCKKALAPYIGVCATEVSASIWDGTSLKADKANQGFSGLGLVGKGDALRLSEVK